MFPSEIFPHRPVDQDTPLLKAEPGFESLCGNHDRMAEWSMAAVCNTVFRGFESRSCLHKKLLLRVWIMIIETEYYIAGG